MFQQLEAITQSRVRLPVIQAPAKKSPDLKGCTASFCRALRSDPRIVCVIRAKVLLRSQEPAATIT
jgi:hypothetical protein